MSVYGGFCTRQQETAYGKLTEQLISLLSSTAMSVILGEAIETEQWINQFSNVYRNMLNLEQKKYLYPKYTINVRDLANILGEATPTKTMQTKTPSQRSFKSQTQDYNSGKISRLRSYEESPFELELSNDFQDNPYGLSPIKNRQKKPSNASIQPAIREPVIRERLQYYSPPRQPKKQQPQRTSLQEREPPRLEIPITARNWAPNLLDHYKVRDKRQGGLNTSLPVI